MPSLVRPNAIGAIAGIGVNRHCGIGAIGAIAGIGAIGVKSRKPSRNSSLNRRASTRAASTTSREASTAARDASTARRFASRLKSRDGFARHLGDARGLLADRIHVDARQLAVELARRAICLGV